jgi:hypothetical protein
MVQFGMFFMKPSRDSHLTNHATMPANERGKRSQPTDDDRARWMWLADVALRNSARTDEVADIEAFARKEQAAIKKRIRRTAEQVKRQSKSKH